MTAKPERCNVCRMPLDRVGKESCGIMGRVYVGSAQLVQGVVPPCPLLDTAEARFEIVDVYWLAGTIKDEEARITEPCQEKGEVHAAVSFAQFLGVYNQNLWATGFGQGDISPGEVIGGDPIGDLARSYRLEIDDEN